LERGITAEKKYKEIDKFIEKFVNDGSFNFQVCVGLLTATHRFKHKLRNRKQLWEKTIEKAEDKLSDEQLKTTLNNLE
jgi:hypothetical protein